MNGEHITPLTSVAESSEKFHKFPHPGSPDEAFLFKQIQEKSNEQFQKSFPDKLAYKTVVIIPSFTLDQEILSKVKGVVHFEERLLCLLMLLRMPRTS